MRKFVVVGALLGIVACSNGRSELDDVGDDVDEIESTQSVRLALTGALKVGGGQNYSCALLASGQVRCWGALDTILPFSDYVDLAPGAHHVCALRAGGSVICQHVDSYYNAFGELNAPTVAMTDVSAGLQVTCGVRASDHGVQCWGRNDHGQASAPPGQYARVEVGWSHACAERLDGAAVDCWGLNAHGQASGYPNAVIDFAAGAYHTCYIRAADNMTFCAGMRGPVPAPQDAYTQVTAGLAHACGLRGDGAVRCWGDNTYGQASSPLIGIHVQVGAGAQHTCRVRSPSLVVCAGKNDAGQSSPPP